MMEGPDPVLRVQNCGLIKTQTHRSRPLLHTIAPKHLRGTRMEVDMGDSSCSYITIQKANISSYASYIFVNIIITSRIFGLECSQK